MANAFPTAAGGLGQGLLSGVQTGLQIHQMKQQANIQNQQLAEQKRQQEWENGYRQAALAIQVAGTPHLPAELKARALNNGFLPLWNNKEFNLHGNNDTPFDPFTADSFKDKELLNVLDQAKKIKGDKELSKNPELQAQAVTNLFMDYHAKRGEAEEAQKLALSLVKPDTGTPTFVGTTADGKGVYFEPKTKTFGTAEIPGGGPLTPKATQPTDAQSNAALFAERAAQANQQIADLKKTGFDTASIRAGVQSKLPNAVQPEGVQLYEQSKRNFLAAVLRKESGAAISIGEMKEGDKQYFDQPGDSEKVKEQKAINRQTAIEGIARASGPFKGEINTGGGPKVGIVEDGYKFKGGDPSDPANWEKQ